MSLIDTHCNTCGSDFKIDMGDMTVKELREVLSKRESFECPGHHFEIGSPLISHWVLGEVHEGHAPTEEDWVAERTAHYGQLYTTDELDKKFEVTGFAFGACMAKYKQTGQEVCLEFSHSPKGVRYYHGYVEYKGE